jgi:hypothetical protein
VKVSASMTFPGESCNTSITKTFMAVGIGAKVAIDSVVLDSGLAKFLVVIAFESRRVKANLGNVDVAS